MDKWRLLPRIAGNGALLMALDEAILTARSKGLVPNTLRFYTWNPPAVSVGYFQSTEQEVDIQQVKRFGFDIVRRYTGGGAVLHDKELTYSITLSEADVPHDIVKSYETICQALIRGLKIIGTEAEFKPINDVVVNNKKISGSAQTRRAGVVLQHGTILLDVDVKKMFSVLKVPDEKIRDKLIKDVEDRVTSLKSVSGFDVSVERLEKALAKGFEEVFNVRLEKGELTDDEKEMAKELYKSKYSADNWNYWR